MSVSSLISPFFGVRKGLKMTELEKFKDYMILCGITLNADLKRLGGYPCSQTQLNNVLCGKYNFSEVEKRRCYNACNRARAVKLGILEAPLTVDKKEKDEDGKA